MALPGLSPARPHRLHRARPRGRRTPGSSTCSAASTCTPSARSGHDDDWMREHLNVDPRAVMRAAALLPLRRPGDLRGLPVRRPRAAHRRAPQQRRRRPPRRALRRRPRRRRRLPARAGRHACSASRPRAAARPRGSGGSTSSAPGACSSSSSPTLTARRSTSDPDRSLEGRDDVSEAARRPSTPARASAASASRRRCARRSWPARSPPATWLRQDDIAARLGTSRLPVREALRILETEGLAELPPNRGARVPVLDLDEVNTLLPDARAARAAHADPRASRTSPTRRSTRWRASRRRSRPTTTSAASSPSTATSTWRRTPPARASSCSPRRSGCGTPPSTTAAPS